MNELRELYQEIIIDHGRKPRNFRELEDYTAIKDGFNPLCGDKITLYLREKAGVIEDCSFQGSGCAISMAAASLMTEAVKGKPREEVSQLFADFHALVTQDEVEPTETLGKLAVLAGVKAYPMRVKCATLAWHTLTAAMANNSGLVTTE